MQGVLGGLFATCLRAGHFRKNIVISYSSARGTFLEPRSFTFCSPGHGGLLFGDVFLGVFCYVFDLPAVGVSVLEEILVVKSVFRISSVTPRGPWGRAFWRYSSGLFLSMPK